MTEAECHIYHLYSRYKQCWILRCFQMTSYCYIMCMCLGLTTRDATDAREADTLGRSWYNFLTAGRNSYFPVGCWAGLPRIFCILGSVFCSSANFLRSSHTDLSMLKFIAFTVMVLGLVKFRISVALRPGGFRLIISAKWSWAPSTCRNSMSYCWRLPSTLQRDAWLHVWVLA